VTVVQRLSLLLAIAVPSATAGAATAQWEQLAPLPVARTEVAAAVFGSEIAIVGGFNEDGSHSARVDVYAPALDRWRRLPDLPLTAHHATAVGYRGRIYVLGGYSHLGQPLRTAFVFRGGSWKALPSLPFPRAAAGAALAAGRIVVAGGVVRTSGARLARNALALDLRRGRWSVVPGPTPREHLGVTALGGTVYAVAGRTSGLDTNLTRFEAFRPGDRRWRTLPAVPAPRGGTGAAALSGRVLSIGGEEPSGTIEEVYAFQISTGRWQRLDDLPTSRHGLGVASFGGRVYVIGGGPEPGLTVSDANETLAITG
jgi:non-specific serine/threonine protein kinase